MNESKIAHLQMIQGIITRMWQNSFQIKGWSIGIMIAIFSFARDQSDTRCILFTILPLTIMWFLDSYYLQLERKFRMLYRQDDLEKIEKRLLVDRDTFDIKKQHYANIIIDTSDDSPLELTTKIYNLYISHLNSLK